VADTQNCRRLPKNCSRTPPLGSQNSRRNYPRRTNRPSAITPVMPIAAPWQVGYKVEKFNSLINFENLKGEYLYAMTLYQFYPPALWPFFYVFLLGKSS
jgi:hypothetical protein